MSRVVVEIRGALDDKPFRQSFVLGEDVKTSWASAFGARGLNERSSDLFDVAAAVVRAERMHPGWRTANRPRTVTLQVPLRDPGAWAAGGASALGRALWILTGAQWVLVPSQRRRTLPLPHDVGSESRVNQVILFSGGLDSTSGAAAATSAAATTRLVSVYSREKTLQRELAAELGFEPPFQANVDFADLRRRATLTRSLLFLALGAVVAVSHGCTRLVQFENGILAHAVAPVPGIMMTRHAHPSFHRAMEALFQAVLGDRVLIANPFLMLTKRQCVENALKAWDDRDSLAKVLARTQTCWFHWSNHGHRGEKRPGQACGLCVPCIIRRTTPVASTFGQNLLAKKVRQDPGKSVMFLDLAAFLREVKLSRDGGGFYRLLDADSRVLVAAAGADLGDVRRLYTRFADEFAETFQLRWR